MNQPMLKTWTQYSGIWPMDLTKEHRAPELTMTELEALAALAASLAWKGRTEISPDLRDALFRLLQPLYDLQEQPGVYQKYCTAPVQIFLRAMHERSTSYRAWSEVEWKEILQSHAMRNEMVRAILPVRRLLFLPHTSITEQQKGLFFAFSLGAIFSSHVDALVSRDKRSDLDTRASTWYPLRGH